MGRHDTHAYPGGRAGGGELTMAIVVASHTDDSVPPVGLHDAECCGVSDLGHRPNRFGGAPLAMIKLSWLVRVVCPDGQTRQYLVNQRVARTLQERSVLRRHIEAWQERRLSPEEVA